ncbi:MAG: thioredoxin family protein [Cyclobacteriaceae bacterium]|nr:thioredoxin family protein [Cyclobacteriaceae bacterium HetDA_MAG_MS6]
MIELAEDNLKQLVGDHDQVIVQYGATWCGNCRITKPKFKRLSTENESIQFVYVDAEKLPDSRALATVKNLPTFAGFKAGKLVAQAEGNKEETIKTILNQLANA